MRFLCWAVLTALVVTAGARLASCPERCHCETETIMMCSRNSYQVSITAERYGKPYLIITCENGLFNYTTDLPNTQIFQNNPSLSVEFKNCPLPDAPLLEVVKLLGDSSINSLKLSNVTGELEAKHLKEIEHTLMKLTLSNLNNTAVPTWAFEILPALKRFSVSGTKLQVKPGDFSSATSLRSLEILFCNVTELPPKVFSSLKQLVVLNLVGNNIRLIDSQFEDMELLKYLDLSSNQIREISVNAFKSSPNLQRISLFENELKEIPTGLFEGLKMLEEITIHKNKNKVQIGAGAFANLPALNTLYLEDCSIADLPNDTFRNSTALQHLYLRRNSIEHMPEDLFKDLGNLTTLNLSRNNIKEVLPKHFANLKSLKRLNLDYNKIEKLASEVFSGLSEVIELSLSNNSIALVDERAFLGCSELTTLRLANNSLTMSWKIDVKEDVSPLNLLVGLKRLDLSGNRIPRLYRDWLLTMLQLESLDLSRNAISMITDEDLEFLQSNNITVNLSNNNITFIYLSRDRPPALAGRVLLARNPLRCDCRLYHFLQIINTPIFDISDLKCNSPPAYKDIYVKNVDAKTLTCPVDTCPSMCSCLQRPATSSTQLQCTRQPNETLIPDLREQGLTITVLRINKTISKLEHLPDFVNEVVLSNLNLTSAPPGNYSVEVMDLSHNQISSVGELFSINNRTSYRLANNSFVCDCDHRRDVIGIQTNHRRILDYRDVMCGKEFVWRVDGKRLCSTRDALVLATLIASVALFMLILTVLYYNYQREIRLFLFYHGLWPASAEEALDKDKKYDAFISFAHEDEDFVVNKLLTVLENEPYNFKMCVHLRDWVPGMFIQHQIVQSVEDSRRTILVLSRSFVESTWSLLEFGAALTNATSERRAKIIVIVLDDVTETTELDKDLKAYISKNTYVKWGDPWFWEKLVYALPKRHKVRKEKIEPKGKELERKLAENALDARIVFGNKQRY